RGGMGTVYRAWHSLRRRYVALKIIKPDAAIAARYEMFRDLFLREGAILMSVTHENVVGCYDVNEALHDGKPALFMAVELRGGEPPVHVARAVRRAARVHGALGPL